MDTEDHKQVHISVKNVLHTLEAHQCQKCTKFHCPLCPKDKIAFDENFQAVGHLQSHLSWVVVHGNFKMFKCHHLCRAAPHYHCCYCGQQIIRRTDLKKHILKHVTKGDQPSEQICVSSDQTLNVVQGKGDLPSEEVHVSSDQIPLVVQVKRDQPSEWVHESSDQIPLVVPGKGDQTSEGVHVHRHPQFTMKHLKTTPKLVLCPKCNVRLHLKNLQRHIKRRHTSETLDICSDYHHQSQCIDAKNGIFAVAKNFSGPPVPIHVKQKLKGPSECEADDCILFYDVAGRSGHQSFRCAHLRSLDYCSTPSETVHLEEGALTELVEQRWFTENRKEVCLALLKKAAEQSAPLAVGVKIGPPKRHYVSVLESRPSYYSRLGRVMVMYDAQKNSWHCPCANARMTCPHKCIAKWYLFQTNRLLFKSVKFTVQDETTLFDLQEKGEESAFACEEELLRQILKYILDKKQYPTDLPENLVKPVFEPPPPKHIVPTEKFCTECSSDLPLSDPILITDKAKIVTLTHVHEGISTYFRKCHRCGMEYRYQDWEDGIHNFDNHILMSFHLCLFLRASLQTHNAAGRVFKAMEISSGLKLPSHNRLFHGYLQFEALMQHDYNFSCINCGSHPPVVIMDLHKKGVFSMPVSEVPNPIEYTGEVNIKDFWESVSFHVISFGFVNVGEENPFIVKPTFEFWAPWIGPQTRKSDVVLNTEWEKMHRPVKKSEQAELDISEDRLLEEVMKMKVDEVKNLCKSCGVDPCGSKTDLIIRLHNEIKSRSTYDKIFEKVWGASGGWSTVMCPCGVVYSLKFNLRAESPRDYIDILQSWHHLPNVSIYDFARGLATHGNLRNPLVLPFAPHEGRLLSPTDDNISLAKEGKVKVNLPWLTESKNPPDVNGHPITGSSEHYVLYDKLHETNAKDPKELLRRTALVPELAGKVNTQVVEQFFSQMEKNNYFLNMMAPSSQIFLIRNLVHHHNTLLNRSRMEKIQKSMATKQINMNRNGQLVIGHSQEILHFESIQSQVPTNYQLKAEAVTELKNVRPSMNCWQHLLSGELQEKVSLVLDETKDPNEHVVHVYGETLTRHSQEIVHFESIQSQVPTDSQLKAEAVTELKNVRPSMNCWQHPLSAELQEKVSYVLDEAKDPKEHIVRVYGQTLTREDFLTLGLQNEVEGMMMNSCLRVITQIGSMRNIDIWMVSSYISVTWLPPLSADPMDHFPADISNKDVIVLPSWKPGHWMTAGACSKNYTRSVDRNCPK